MNKKYSSIENYSKDIISVDDIHLIYDSINLPETSIIKKAKFTILTCAHCQAQTCRKNCPNLSKRQALQILTLKASSQLSKFTLANLATLLSCVQTGQKQLWTKLRNWAANLSLQTATLSM